MSKANDKIVKVAVESGPWGWALFAAYIGAAFISSVIRKRKQQSVR